MVTVALAVSMGIALPTRAAYGPGPAEEPPPPATEMGEPDAEAPSPDQAEPAPPDAGGVAADWPTPPAYDPSAPRAPLPSYDAPETALQTTRYVRESKGKWGAGIAFYGLTGASVVSGVTLLGIGLAEGEKVLWLSGLSVAIVGTLVFTPIASMLVDGRNPWVEQSKTVADARRFDLSPTGFRLRF